MNKLNFSPSSTIHLGRILDNEMNKSLTQKEVDDLIKLLILYKKPNDIEEYLFQLKHSVNSLFDKLISSIIDFKIQNDEFIEEVNKKKLLRETEINEDETLTIEEVCSMMKISRPTIYKWFILGLEKTSVGKRVFINKSELKRFLKDNSINYKNKNDL